MKHDTITNEATLAIFKAETPKLETARTRTITWDDGDVSLHIGSGAFTLDLFMTLDEANELRQMLDAAIKMTRMVQPENKIRVLQKVTE